MRFNVVFFLLLLSTFSEINFNANFYAQKKKKKKINHLIKNYKYLHYIFLTQNKVINY
jgi:hypothetical protein